MQHSTPLENGSSTPVLEVLKAVRHFDGSRTKALNGISFSVDAGEVVAITGPSGAGKTTLMNVVSGLDQLDSGHINWFGHPVHSNREWRRLRRLYIGIVFQEFHLIPTLTATQNVELAMVWDRVARSEKRAKAFALLKDVGLGKRADNLPNEMSGGERQRVAIARALVGDPRVVLADEPTGNLDSDSSAMIIDLLLSLRKKRNMSLVIVTHEPSVAQSCERRLNVVDGVVTGDGKGVIR